jgi:hypothetical protein
MARKVRQAVVVVHGMGEQRPLDTLNGFIGAALPEATGSAPAFYSRPDWVTDSYEARRYLAPPREAEDGTELHAQAEFYEYHWAHLMQGNRLDDLWPTMRRMLLQPPTAVPAGLRVVWALFWAIILAAVWAVLWGPLKGVDLAGSSFTKLLGALVGGGLIAWVLTYIVARVLPGWITGSFVDVVRYLDTTPRSYEVRRNIRKGIVELLQGLHDSGRYQRIVIVAHSLGSYIAYDAITYLWAQMNWRHAAATGPVGRRGSSPDGLLELEQAASALGGGCTGLDAFRAAQRRLWLGLRQQGNPWLITDFISLGSPMYFADRLYTKNQREFADRVAKRELPTCPPQPELTDYNNVNRTRLWYSFRTGPVRSLYHAAPFAVVRWTNFWFPSALGFFGDWFGGPLASLLGPGIEDVAVQGNRWKRFIPGYAHALYFRLAHPGPDSIRSLLRAAMDLASSSWLTATLDAPEPTAPASQKRVPTEDVDTLLAGARREHLTERQEST